MDIDQGPPTLLDTDVARRLLDPAGPAHPGAGLPHPLPAQPAERSR